MPGALVVSCYCLSHGGISEEEGLRGEVGGGGIAVRIMHINYLIQSLGHVEIQYTVDDKMSYQVFNT